VKISNRTEYGVRALVYLARHPEELLSVTRIAQEEGIPLSFLEQILSSLRRAGLVVAVRGAGGGYQLSRSPSDITLGEAVAVLEGSLSPIGCVEPGADGHSFCDRLSSCQTRKVWMKMTESIAEALNRLTLADVTEEH
jgi:Rrf2 family protein